MRAEDFVHELRERAAAWNVSPVMEKIFGEPMRFILTCMLHVRLIRGRRIPLSYEDILCVCDELTHQEFDAFFRYAIPNIVPDEMIDRVVFDGGMKRTVRSATSDIISDRLFSSDEHEIFVMNVKFLLLPEIRPVSDLAPLLEKTLNTWKALLNFKYAVAYTDDVFMYSKVDKHRKARKANYVTRTRTSLSGQTIYYLGARFVVTKRKK